MTPQIIPQRVLDRIWERVDVREPDECWPWLLSTIPRGGHGQVGWQENGRNHMTTAHRAAYAAANGGITPVGFDVDHICKNRICCNPDHLRLLTHEANSSLTSWRKKRECPHGHPYDEVNTYIGPNGWRRCRTCNTLRQTPEAKAERARRKAAQ